MTTLALQLRGWRLTTAEILYFLPDHPSLLQSFIWQQLDRAPDFPQLHRFLDFWAHSLDGRLHSVTVASCELVKPAEARVVHEAGWLH
ncbi:MAG: usg protein [Solirubrobacterales bacterium]